MTIWQKWVITIVFVVVMLGGVWALFGNGSIIMGDTEPTSTTEEEVQ